MTAIDVILPASDHPPNMILFTVAVVSLIGIAIAAFQHRRVQVVGKARLDGFVFAYPVVAVLTFVAWLRWPSNTRTVVAAGLACAVATLAAHINRRRDRRRRWYAAAEGHGLGSVAPAAATTPPCADPRWTYRVTAQAKGDRRNLRLIVSEFRRRRSALGWRFSEWYTEAAVELDHDLPDLQLGPELASGRLDGRDPPERVREVFVRRGEDAFVGALLDASFCEWLFATKDHFDVLKIEGGHVVASGPRLEPDGVVALVDVACAFTERVGALADQG